MIFQYTTSVSFLVMLKNKKTESLILNPQYCTANVHCLLLPLASYLQVCLSMYQAMLLSRLAF